MVAVAYHSAPAVAPVGEPDRPPCDTSPGTSVSPGTVTAIVVGLLAMTGKSGDCAEARSVPETVDTNIRQPEALAVGNWKGKIVVPLVRFCWILVCVA